MKYSIDPVYASLFPQFGHPSVHPSTNSSIYPTIHSLLCASGEVNSPNGVMCLQEMDGSGFPLAVQMSDTLLPSFTVMSEEMSYILGGTKKQGKKK